MLDPEGIDALLNLADMESRLGDPAAASKIYDKVLSMLAPHENGRKDLVKFYASMVYKQLGRLQDYWDGYECGFNPFIPKGAARSPNRLFKVPKWDGSKVSNKKLLVWREQGVGDEILYSSILPELESLGMEVIFECEARLVSVWKRSFPGFVVREARFDGVSMYPLIQDFDLHLPICSLGSLFRRSVESFERFRPFIIPKEDLLLEYKKKLDAVSKGRPKVGVLWRSVKLTPARVRAYTNPEEWDGILDREDLCFINLQYGLHESERDSIRATFGNVLNIFEEIDLKDDFERTIACVANLDLVISPDTTMFEIAGSLGVRTLLMTVWPRGYFGRIDRFIFYPSVELVRASSFNPNSALEALENTKSRLRDIYGEGKL
jgi:hypothetical protein